MDDIEKRVRRIEINFLPHMVSWLLNDGTRVEVDKSELQSCFLSVMRHELHPLLGRVLDADVRSYSGSDTFIPLIQKLCESRERREQSKS